jgi:hypothetical protein
MELHAVLFPGGKGRHLTDSEVISQKRALENAKETAAVDKATKKGNREAKRAEKGRLEAEWKKMLAEHQCEVTEWEEECQELREGGTLVKDLPRKPKRPLKPKPKESDDEGDEGDESGDDSSVDQS